MTTSSDTYGVIGLDVPVTGSIQTGLGDAPLTKGLQLSVPIAGGRQGLAVESLSDASDAAVSGDSFNYAFNSTTSIDSNDIYDNSLNLNSTYNTIKNDFSQIFDYYLTTQEGSTFLNDFITNNFETIINNYITNGGEVGSLGDLTDVDLTDIANGKILKYNSTTSKWECEDDTGSSAVDSLGDLSDVDLTDIANGKVIKYNSTTGKWECEDDSVGPTYTAGNGIAISEAGVISVVPSDFLDACA